MSRREAGRLLGALACGCLMACGEPASYPELVSQRLRTEIPEARVEAAGETLVVRVGQRETRIEVADIQRLCSRGPRECERALESAVLEARGEAR